ncbi:MAG: hypothetical protein WDO19_18640 [Bacteroidota bacterium]
MKIYLLPNWSILLCYIFISHLVIAQNASVSVTHKPFRKAGLFESDEVLPITLKGNLQDLLKNRYGDPQYYPLTISLAEKNSPEITMQVKVKTRGHFRRMKSNCIYPPLLISFSKEDRQSSALLGNQAKLKLVMPCQGDEYVVREWLVYKLYNLITPESFRARLVRVTLKDEKNKKDVTPFFGILLEEEQQMAGRNNAVPVNRKLGPEQTMPDAFLNMAMFQYLIGNTDWSVQYLQNMKLIAQDSMGIAITVPYDFDHAGIVNCPYAQPAEELRMTSVRERRYRGYCINDMNAFDSVIAHYNNLKNAIYNLYTGCPLLNEKYIKTTVKYLDEFYATINNPKALKKRINVPL